MAHARTDAFADEPEDCLVADLLADAVHEQVVDDGIEIRIEVAIDAPSRSLLTVFTDVFDGGLCLPSLPETVALVAEAEIKDGRQHLGYGLLDDSVQDDGNAQLTLLAVWLGNPDSSHRGGLVTARTDLIEQKREVLAGKLRKGGNGHPIDTCGLPCCPSRIPTHSGCWPDQ